MDITACAWIEEPSPEGHALPWLLRCKRNESLAKFAAAVKVFSEQYADQAGVAGLTDSYHLAKSLPPAVLGAVFQDPRMVYWNDRVQSLIGRLRNEEAIIPTDLPYLPPDCTDWDHSLLACHLLDVNRFLVTAALRARIDVSVPCLAPEGWLFLPGTGVGIRTNGLTPIARVETACKTGRAVRVDGCAVITLDEELREGATSSGPVIVSPTLEVLPTVTGSGGTILLHPHDSYYRRAWITPEQFPGVSMANEIGTDELPQWAATLSDTFALLREVWPAMEAAVTMGLHTIVPISSPIAGKSLSCSAPCFWGAVMCSLDEPILMAETLLHEFSHNVLYSVIDYFGVFSGDASAAAVYYSPWRPDPRPLAGVLHAVYVFERVTEYYQRLFNSRQVDEALRHRYAAILGRLRIGIETLRTFGRFNEAGKRFIDCLDAKVQQHRANSLVLMSDGIRQELVDNYSRWRERNPQGLAPNPTFDA
jgi:HEXXH motif-containing protein